MLRTLTWLAPEIGLLQQPNPLHAVVGSVTVEQAARIARISLSEVLYALNLAAGETEEDLAKELNPSGNRVSENKKLRATALDRL